MGGPGRHSQTQARCVAAHGDCYVSRYLWAGGSGHAAMRKRTKSWMPFGCLGIQVCRYSPNIFSKTKTTWVSVDEQPAANSINIHLPYMFEYYKVSPHIFFFGWSLNSFVRMYTGRRACSCVPGYCNSTVVWAARTCTFRLYTIYMHEPFNWLHQVQYSHIRWKYNSEQLSLDQTNKWRHQPHVVLGEEGRLAIVCVRVLRWVMSRVNYVWLRLPTYIFICILLQHTYAKTIGWMWTA